MRTWHRIALVAVTVTMTALGPTGSDAADAHHRTGHDRGGDTTPTSGDTTPTTTDGAGTTRSELSFGVASFNILGSQHTAGSSRWASGTTRARLAKRWLREQRVSVVGLQEAQVDQMKVFVAGPGWSAFPNPHTSRDTQTAQSIAWRSGRWDLLQAKTFTIPFHYGQQRQQPMVLLKDRRTGRRVWVVTVHFTSGHSPRAVYERKVGTRKLIRNVTALEATRVPVLVTGDMNDHATFFCRITGATSLESPAGGSNDGVCVPPVSMRIDWLLGSRRFAWSGFRFAEDPVLSRVTDHTVPTARVGLGR